MNIDIIARCSCYVISNSRSTFVIGQRVDDRLIEEAARMAYHRQEDNWGTFTRIELEIISITVHDSIRGRSIDLTQAGNRDGDIYSTNRRYREIDLVIGD